MLSEQVQVTLYAVKVYIGHRVQMFRVFGLHLMDNIQHRRVRSLEFHSFSSV